MNFDTRLVRPHRDGVDPHGASSPPIYQTATFRQPDARASGRYDYSRSGNPTRRGIEHHVADLEGARHGFAFTSGIAAIAAVLATVSPGGRVVVGRDLYGGTWRLLHDLEARGAIAVMCVDTSDPQAVHEALESSVELVLLETPTNPLQAIVDVAHTCDRAHAVGALVAVDNTFLSPLLQRPLELGADIVIHSATKHLAGHADVIAGLVVTSNDDVAERIAFVQNAYGSALAPLDAWLLGRGLATLAVRLERAQSSAGRLARLVERHPSVVVTHYVGLRDHPGHALHHSQAHGPGSVFSFRTGCVERSAQLIDALALFSVTVSFGSTCSTIGMPCRMSHASIPAAERRLPDDLIRVSVGLEDVDDLASDLESALDRCHLPPPKALRERKERVS